jgi:glycine/sarcosine N-methyltransferase
MGFYEDFAECYESIFPADIVTTAFLTRYLPAAPARLLDLACGTGGYSREMAKLGLAVSGVDLSEPMIKLARQKTAGIDGLSFQVADMASPPAGERFDGWFCIGNSLVHLPYGGAIPTALCNWKEALVPGGRWVIQILNYDRILKNSVMQLPIIEAGDGTTLLRHYEHISDRTIIFYTELTYQGRKYHSKTPLYPVTRKVLRELLLDAGLRIHGEFGEFDESPWTEASFAYIVCGTS